MSSKYISLSYVLWARTGPLFRHVAQLRMETLHLAGKWAEVGGAIMDALELPVALTPDGSDRKARLTNQSHRRLLQEGLNRSLPIEKAGKGKEMASFSTENLIKTKLYGSGSERQCMFYPHKTC